MRPMKSAPSSNNAVACGVATARAIASRSSYQSSAIPSTATSVDGMSGRLRSSRMCDWTERRSPGTAPARGACTSTQCRTNSSGVIPSLRVSNEMLLIIAASPRWCDGLAAAAPDPVERENANPVRRGRLDPRREIGAIARRDVAQHPCSRPPDDLAVRVEPLDLELHVGGRQAAVLAIQHNAELRPRLAGRDLKLDPEALIEAFLW